MKRRWSIVFAWLLLAAVVLALLWRKPAPAVEQGTAAPEPKSQTAAKRSPAAVLAEPGRTRGPEVISETRRDAVSDEIQNAVITYAPEGVKPIADHLLDSDPEIREAARQGLVQLGEATAIPLLRAAGRRLGDESEAAACEESAAKLELPSWSETEEARALSAELAHPTDP